MGIGCGGERGGWVIWERTLTHTYILPRVKLGFPGGPSAKESTCQCRRPGLHPWVGASPRSWKWQPTPVLLPGKSHGQRSLVGYSSWGHKGLDMTEHSTAQQFLKLYTKFCICGHKCSFLGLKLQKLLLSSSEKCGPDDTKPQMMIVCLFL